jgi:hypothetical protein
MAFPAQPPDLRRLSLGRESFAFTCTLALLGNASYPVSVRRLDGFATPLLSALPSREDALRIASVPTTKFREDFHLRTIAHAGHTHEKRPWSAEANQGRMLLRRISGGGGTRTPMRLPAPHFECEGHLPDLSHFVRIRGEKSGTSALPRPSSSRHVRSNPGTSAGNPAGGCSAPPQWCATQWYGAVQLLVVADSRPTPSPAPGVVRVSRCTTAGPAARSDGTSAVAPGKFDECAGCASDRSGGLG